MLAEFRVELVFHLAALLSTRSEFTPMTAHQVNVEGTLNLLEFAQHEAESHGRPVVFMYPSSIAAYGLPDRETKAARRQGQGGRVDAPDDDVRVQQAVLRAAGTLLRAALQAARRGAGERARRFPVRAFSRADFGGDDAVGRDVGLCAGDDSRGGEGGAVCSCFVRPDTRIPFMAMPDGVEALMTLAAAPRERADAHRLQRRRVQSVGGGDSATSCSRRFPTARIDWDTDTKRQGIVDSWPADVDDSAARRDWGFEPQLRLRSRLLGLPHPADPRTVSALGKREATALRGGSMLAGTPERSEA